MSRSVSSSSRQWPVLSPTPPDRPAPASFQIVGAEVHRRTGRQRQGDGSAALAGIVDGVDAHRSGLRGIVDDPDVSILGVARRHHQRKRVLVLRQGARCLREDDGERRQHSEDDAGSIASWHFALLRRMDACGRSAPLSSRNMDPRKAELQTQILCSEAKMLYPKVPSVNGRLATTQAWRGPIEKGAGWLPTGKRDPR